MYASLFLKKSFEIKLSKVYDFYFEYAHNYSKQYVLDG
jgi:hypothetical protein